MSVVLVDYLVLVIYIIPLVEYLSTPLKIIFHRLTKPGINTCKDTVKSTQSIVTRIFPWRVDCAFWSSCDQLTLYVLLGVVIHGTVWHVDNFQTMPNSVTIWLCALSWLVTRDELTMSPLDWYTTCTLPRSLIYIMHAFLTFRKSTEDWFGIPYMTIACL